jgi:hypothetical protein
MQQDFVDIRAAPRDPSSRAGSAVGVDGSGLNGSGAGDGEGDGEAHRILQVGGWWWRRRWWR